MTPVAMHCNTKDESVLGAPGYLMQRKYDGTRCLVTKDGGNITMEGRSGKLTYNDNFPDILQELSQIPLDFIIDGELTFFRGDKDEFLTVLAKPETKYGMSARLMVFDLLSLGGYGPLVTRDTRMWPIEKRLEGLGIILSGWSFKSVKLIETFSNPAKFQDIYNQIISSGGEGVVLKRCGSPYVGDSREYWTKIKRGDTADCIISGITQGKGERADTFGSLILSQVDNGRLVHVGNASGFDTATLNKLYSMIMAMPDEEQFKPYDSQQPLGKYVKRVIRPKLVAEIRYMNRTPYNMLRHPVFLRLRDDKTPDECCINIIGTPVMRLKDVYGEV